MLVFIAVVKMKMLTFEFLKHSYKILTFLNDFILTCFLAHPKVSQVSQGKAPHLFP